MGGRGSGSGGRAERTRAQDQKIKDIARRTANLKKEQYRVVNENGEVVMEKKGDAHAVRSTVGEKREAFWNNEGSISIHNHPAGGTFSWEDLDDFGYGAKEVVVTAPEGTYRLIKKTKQTPDWIEMRDRLDEIHERMENTSSLDIRKQALEIADRSPQAKELQRISNRWAEIRRTKGDAEAQKYNESIRAEFERLQAERRDIVAREQRRLEVEPYDKALKKYASRYGLIYKFEPKKKKK